MDKNAILAFFDMYERPVDVAELNYFRDVFSVDKDTKVTPLDLDAEYLPGRQAGRRSSEVTFVSSPQSVHSVDFHQQYRLATRKWRRAQRVCDFFKIFPWISGVAIANTLSFLSVKESSDIDLFIICKPRRVWFVRLCVVSFLRLLRLRPGEAARDPVCPTFFVDETHLDLSTIALSGGDSYLLFWLATLAPVWGDACIWERFFNANRWALQRTVGALQPTRGRCVTVICKTLSIVDSILWENVARRVQMACMPKALHDAAALCDTRVVIGESMLKFHENDRRAIYHQLWQENYANRTRMVKASGTD